MALREKALDAVFENAANVFDLPSEIMGGVSRITLLGGRRVFIESHRGLLEYSDERITVNGGTITVSVCGERLKIRSMSASEMMIYGIVNSVVLGRE